MQDQPTYDQRAFGPLVETCRAHGIGRTTAFELAANGTLKTFHIGTRRYVTMQSLRDLPALMAANDDDAGRDVA